MDMAFGRGKGLRRAQVLGRARHVPGAPRKFVIRPVMADAGGGPQIRLKAAQHRVHRIQIVRIEGSTIGAEADIGAAFALDPDRVYQVQGRAGRGRRLARG